MPMRMDLGTRVQFPPPPLKGHLRFLASGLSVCVCVDSTQYGPGPKWALGAISGLLWVLWNVGSGARSPIMGHIAPGASISHSEMTDCPARKTRANGRPTL